jgi:hypothetical protein
MNRHQSLIFFFCVAVMLAGSQALAQFSPGGGINTSDPNLPPIPSTYDWPTTMYHGPGLAITLSQMHFHPFGVSRVPSGSNEIETFNSIMSGLISVNGSATVPGANSSGPVMTEAFGKVGNTTGTFNTEMLSMNLSGSSPFGPYLLRENPARASLGQTSISDIGGGLYHIDSFFDVFTELSVDGGATWMPSDSSSHVDLNPSPEPSTLLLLGIGSISLLGYRKAKSLS